MFGLYIVTALVFVSVVVLFVAYRRRSLRLTSSTAGHVVRAEERVVCDADERREETVIVCRYTVAGREYEVSRVLSGRGAERFPVGRKFTIRYDPAEPHHAELSLR